MNYLRKVVSREMDSFMNSLKPATEETLQSIDSTLKRIEIILLQLQNQSFVLDAQGLFLQMSKENSIDLHAE